MTSYGLILFGRPGVGITPTAIILTLAVAGHLVTARGLECHIPVWRRSKQIDGFRERLGDLHVHVLLHDPLLASMNMEDVKSFLHVGENTLADARYRAAKFVRNQCRIDTDSLWGSEKRAQNDCRLKDMFGPTVNNASTPHLMAILKLCVRLASEHQNQAIHRFAAQRLQDDWLNSANKRFHSMCQDGQHVKTPSYQEALGAEASLVSEPFASPEEKEDLALGHSQDEWAADYGEDAPAMTTPRNPSTFDSTHGTES